ncbi:unnamed protein product, partial [Bubo scandiacus]
SYLPGESICVPFSLPSPRRSHFEPLEMERKKNLLTYIIEPCKPLLDTYNRRELAPPRGARAQPSAEPVPAHTGGLFALCLCDIDPTPSAASSRFSES